MLIKNRAGGPVHLLRCTPFSYADPQFNRSVGAGFYEKEIIDTQIRQIDQSLKDRFSNIDVWHLLDRNRAARRRDDQATFELIEGLGSNFVIRLKANRNSNETTSDDRGKAVSVKLLEAPLESSLTQILDRFVWKNRVYQQASLMTTYGKLRLENKTYQVARIQVSDRENRPVFPNNLHLFERRVGLL